MTIPNINIGQRLSVQTRTHFVLFICSSLVVATSDYLYAKVLRCIIKISWPACGIYIAFLPTSSEYMREKLCHLVQRSHSRSDIFDPGTNKIRNHFRFNYLPFTNTIEGLGFCIRQTHDSKKTFWLANDLCTTNAITDQADGSRACFWLMINFLQ